MPAAIEMDADQVPPAMHRVKDLPSAAQFQAPTSHVPEVLEELVPVLSGTAAEVADVATAADEATEAWVAAALDWEAGSVAKTPGADCEIALADDTTLTELLTAGADVAAAAPEEVELPAEVSAAPTAPQLPSGSPRV